MCLTGEIEKPDSVGQKKLHTYLESWRAVPCGVAAHVAKLMAEVEGRERSGWQERSAGNAVKKAAAQARQAGVSVTQ
jgi:hypothetical protein